MRVHPFYVPYDFKENAQNRIQFLQIKVSYISSQNLSPLPLLSTHTKTDFG